jgi:hypothetical protein
MNDTNTKSETYQRDTWGLSTLTGLLPLVDWDNCEGDFVATVRAAGFNPDDEEVSVGILRASYAGLPKGTEVVSGQTTEGAPFAYGQSFADARAQAGAR